MQKTFHILTLLLVSTLISCVQQNDKKEKERLEKRSAIEEQASADSLRHDQVLQRALKIAQQQIKKDFQKTLNLSIRLFHQKRK